MASHETATPMRTHQRGRRYSPGDKEQILACAQGEGVAQAIKKSKCSDWAISFLLQCVTFLGAVSNVLTITSATFPSSIARGAPGAARRRARQGDLERNALATSPRWVESRRTRNQTVTFGSPRRRSVG